MKLNCEKTDAEWKKQLTSEQYEILRLKGTERPGSGKYNSHFEKGIYTCAGCGSELFTNDQKFDRRFFHLERFPPLRKLTRARNLSRS